MKCKRPARVTAAHIKAFRRRFHLSARELGEALGYTRSYIKTMEGGATPIPRTFRARFIALEARMNYGTHLTDIDPTDRGI